MKLKKVLIGLIFILIMLSGCESRMDTESKEIIENWYGNNIKISKTENVFPEKLPALTNSYVLNSGSDNYYIYEVNPKGYEDAIRMLVSIDATKEVIDRVEIIKHKEDLLYAGKINEKWFLERFNKSVKSYIKMVPLEIDNDYEVIQMTGATVSSQAVANGVNTAMAAFNSIKNGQEPIEIPLDSKKAKNISEKLSVELPNGNMIEISMEDIKNMKHEDISCILRKTTGTELDFNASGVLLSDILNLDGIDLTQYKGIGAKGRDGYYALIPEDMIKNSPIYIVDDLEDTKEGPLRIVLPNEMGVYWVKMLEDISLYKDIAKREINTIYFFESFKNNIEPYYYMYYEKKEESYEIAKLLKNFKSINPNAFFNMTGIDGLSKNETINMVKNRYYIKTEGKNSPMNISPYFKLGMNVKEMLYFSTNSELVLFEESLKKVLLSIDEESFVVPLVEIFDLCGVEYSEKDIVKIYFDKELNKVTENIINVNLQNCNVEIMQDNKIAIQIANGKTIKNIYKIEI